ncbi:MAG: response regulator [Desulfatiglandales bacterium]
MHLHLKLKDKRILIVDDEPDVLDTLEEYLEGCRLFRASSFQEAKEILETQELDLAILDIMGVDGYRLLDLANKKGIPAVMLTAHAFSPDNLMKSIQKGAYSYIPKEKISEIEDFLVDVLEAREKDQNPWQKWQTRLPETYFEKRWGKAWKDMDKEFWETFKASIEERKKSKAP